MQQPSGNFRLIVRRGPQPNQIHELAKDVMTIGRDITNDITINDPECSRHHARMTRGGGGYTIEDLGSTNGTFVNGQRLTGARPLSPGDMLGLGETVTLAYEAVGMAAGMTAPSGGLNPPVDNPYAPPAAAMQPPAPQPQNPYVPQQPQNPYAPQPQNPYAPPPPGYNPYQPQPQNPYMPQQPGMPPYAYGEQQPSSPYAPQYEPEPERGGFGRWLLLGCGCFIVLCVITSVVLLIVIDTTCAWEQEPLASVVESLGLGANENFGACQ